MCPSPETFNQQTPKDLVENRVSFAGAHAELSIYDTFLPAEQVGLKADEFLYCGMLSGKKVMHGEKRRHSGQYYSIPFYPHESFVMAPSTQVTIDFPDATIQCPTRCMTIEITRERISEIASRLAHQQQAYIHESFLVIKPLQEDDVLHTPHTQGTEALLGRLFKSFTHNDSDRDIAIDFGVSELVTRVLLHKGREFLLKNVREDPEKNAINASIAMIEKTLASPLDIDSLCKTACMSRSRFYRIFKYHLGCTPAELQHKLRLDQAAKRIADGEPITAIAFDLGYKSISHFYHRFQRQYGCSPKNYNKQKGYVSQE